VCKPPLEETMILQDKTREEGSKLSNALSKFEYSFFSIYPSLKFTKRAPLFIA